MHNQQASTNQPSAKDEPRKTKPKHQVNTKLVTYIACGVIATVSLIIIVWVFITTLNKPPVSDEYFVSDDTKSVISMDPEEKTSTSSSHTHIVYEYDGENVTSLKTYFEYPDPETARNAYESLKDQPEFKNSELKDKYIIVTADPSQFKGLTASDVRQQAAAIEQYQSSKKQKEEQTDTETENQEPQPEDQLEDQEGQE